MHNKFLRVLRVLVSLQTGPGVEQMRGVAGRFAVVELGGEVDAGAGAFMDTAALMQHLDLLITSDTAIAHLAGALGAWVWLALAKAADWRWLSEREGSPWYPTMRLFRQREWGCWQEVFQQISAEFAAQRT